MVVAQLRLSLCKPTETITHQVPLSVEFSRQEYCSELLFAPPGDLSDSGIEPRSPELQADSLSSDTPVKVSFYLLN